jgi:hypothetical protein
MMTMSIAQFAQEFDAAKTRTARVRLFFRSLGLRFKLWNTGRVMERDWRRARCMRA